jgi:acyl-CoA synthetase (AMP-forming)/AMP-acid ligase II
MTIRTIRRLDLALRRRESLGGILDRLAALHGDRRMVTEHGSGRVLTFRDAAVLVAEWSERLASVIAPGEPVVVATPNGYDQLLLSLAVARAGGLPAPVNDQMREREIRHVVADAGASLVLRRAADVPATKGVVPVTTPEPGDAAALFYTSGTTGAPKGATLTHRSLVGQAAGATMFPAHLRNDEVVAGLPVAHIMGFAAYLAIAIAGVPVYCFERFRAGEVLDVIEERHPSAFVGVPAMYRMLFEAGAARRDLTSIRIWMSGADVMPPELAKEFKRFGATVTLPVIGAVGEAAFVEGYGMVEVGGGVAAKVSPPGISLGVGDSLGFRLPGYRFRVVDDDDRDVSLGEVGELWVKGPGLLRGYWNAPDATAEALTDDGWLRTGDLVRSGPLGTVVFAGRRKHLIKSGGYSVYPLEVETVLEQHPDVIEAAVVGVPDPKLGELPMAAVRLVPDATVGPAELADWAADRLAHYKAPRRIVVVDDLPRNATEKVRKDQLAELFD